VNEFTQEAMQFIKNVWATLKHNPMFVTFYSAAAGAVGSWVEDQLTTGHIDFSTAGIHKCIGYAVTTGIAAVVHLYRTPPGTNPQQ
jgi:hypothetical protein